MILGSLLRQLKQGIYFYFLCVLLNFIRWWWAVTVCVFRHSLSNQSWLLLLVAHQPCLKMLLGIVVQTELITWRLHIKTISKQPDTSGHFLMVFSIFKPLWTAFLSFVHVYLKCLITRENNSFTLRQINHYFFSLFCINWSCLPGSGSVFVFMWHSPVLSYGVWHKGLSCT